MRLLSRIPPEPHADHATLTMYARALNALRAREVPFLVGGTWSLKHHCGIVRDTKDVDLFVARADLDGALNALSRNGFRTERTFPHWLAKAWSGERFIDVIFDAGNGAAPVDAGWFEHAELGVLLGVPVRICPAEETIWSKAFIMERERYDGADVLHLLLARRADLDWSRLITRFGAHYRVLLSHLILFGYVYPREAREVPAWVLPALLARIDEESPSADAPLCRGTMLSRKQYLVDLERGYVDGRLAPAGAMRPEDIATWTAAIWQRP